MRQCWFLGCASSSWRLQQASSIRANLLPVGSFARLFHVDALIRVSTTRHSTSLGSVHLFVWCRVCTGATCKQRSLVLAVAAAPRQCTAPLQPEVAFPVSAVRLHALSAWRLPDPDSGLLAQQLRVVRFFVEGRTRQRQHHHPRSMDVRPRCLQRLVNVSAIQGLSACQIKPLSVSQELQAFAVIWGTRGHYAFGMLKSS